MSVRTSPSDGLVSLPEVSRYDLLLALLPVPLCSGLLAGSLGSLSTTLGAAAGAVPSLLLVLYGLFVEAPR